MSLQAPEEELDLDALSQHPGIRRLMERIHRSLGLNIVFLTPAGRLRGVAPGKWMPTTNALCAAVVSDARGGGTAGCNAAAKSMLVKSRSGSGSEEFAQTTCHMGLQAIGARMVVGGKPFGLIASCGFLRAERVFRDEQEVAERATKAGYARTAEDAVRAIRTAPLINEREVRFAADLIELLVDELLRYVTEQQRSQETIRQAHGAIDLAQRPEPILGECPAIGQARELVDRIAGKRLPMLVHGAPGTGKFLLARHLHLGGGRPRAPLVCLDLRRQSPDFDEVIRLAGRGTAVLQGVHALSAERQRTLSRAITAHPDVFWIGTAPDPLLLTPELRATLGMVAFHLPALAQRGRDVEGLALHFAWTYAGQKTLPEAVRRALAAYPWPGNVTELQIVLRRAAMLAGPQPIDTLHLPREVAALGSSPRRAGTSFKEEVLAFKMSLIRDALDRSGDSVSGAARDLGMQRTSLHRLMAELGVKPARRPRARKA